MPQYSQKLSRRPLEGEIVKKPETPGRKIYIGTVNIFAPPLAAKVHGRYRDRHSAHLIFDTILALIIFVLLGVNIWYATRDEVVAIPEPELSLNLPESVLSGQIFKIALEVSNATNQIIRDVDVRLDPPAGFSFTKSAPDPDNDVDLQWSYATLEANATSTVLISGKLFGIAGSQVPISFSVSYGDEYNFATAKRGSVRIAGSSTVLSASAPRQVTGDEQFTVSTRIQNSGTDVFPSSSINLELPEGFILLGSNIPDSDHDGWLVPELEPAAAWELSIRGNFPSLQERNELFRFTHSVSVSSGLVELESAEVSVQQVLPAPEESADVDDILSPDQPTLENLSLASDAVYTSHSGVELGFGPNPPRAGQRTGYRIIWAV
ncbi:MAG: hypothetical protein Q8Q20_03205, partial [bacterium]|nr:hypothetical protein [bacterium]